MYSNGVAGDSEGRKGSQLATTLFAAVVAIALMQGGCGGCGGIQVSEGSTTTTGGSTTGGITGGTTGGTTGGGALGRLFVFSDFQAATRTVPGYAGALRVTVTPPSGVALPGTFANPFELTRFSTFRMLDNLTASEQPYVLDMEALTDGTVVGTVKRSIVITAGSTEEVDVSANLESAVDSVTVEGVSWIDLGQSQYTAYARDAQGAALFSGRGFRFSSSDPAVLSIDPDSGLATAKTQGTATITALLSGTALSGKLDVLVEVITKIVFTSDRVGRKEIYSMNSNGSDQTRITVTTTPPNEANNAPVYTPDGSNIVFWTNRGGDAEIYVMTANGQNLVNISNDSRDDREPAVSPDGSKIAFTTNRNLVNWQVYLMNSDGTGQVNFSAHASHCRFATFSPDGNSIVFSSNRDGDINNLYRLNIDGTNLVRLTPDGLGGAEATFSPDGTQIAYWVSDGTNSQIHVMNADGTDISQVTTDPSAHYSPTFSPDGTRIAYASNLDGDFEIYVINLDTLVVRKLTDNAAEDLEPSWHP